MTGLSVPAVILMIMSTTSSDSQVLEREVTVVHALSHSEQRLVIDAIRASSIPDKDKLVDRLADQLVENPSERMLRMALEKQTAQITESMTLIASTIEKVRRQTFMIAIFAMILQSALVLSSMSVKLPWASIVTQGQ